MNTLNRQEFSNQENRWFQLHIGEIMDTERAIELLKIEMECIKRASYCDRKCENCELIQNEKELLDMYNFVINRLKYGNMV